MKGLPPQDDGLPDPVLAAARSDGARARVLSVLGTCRVFAAVTATATSSHVTESGLRADSTAEMAVLLLEVDGRRALPVFRDVAGVLAWHDGARPVRLIGADACRAALDEGAEALVLDPGPDAFVLGADELRAVASGWVPVPGSGLATRLGEVELGAPVEVDARLVASLAAALAPEPLLAARLLRGPDGLVLGVAPARRLDPPALAALAQRVVQRLGADLPAEGLDLAQVAPEGPGVVVVPGPRPRRSLLRRRP